MVFFIKWIAILRKSSVYTNNSRDNNPTSHMQRVISSPSAGNQLGWIGYWRCETIKLSAGQGTASAFTKLIKAASTNYPCSFLSLFTNWFMGQQIPYDSAYGMERDTNYWHNGRAWISHSGEHLPEQFTVNKPRVGFHQVQIHSSDMHR